MPFIVWGSIAYQRRLQGRYRDVRERVGELNADLSGNLGGIATIKSYAREDAEAERISAQSDRYRASNARAITLSSAFSPLIRMLILAGFTATLLIGGNSPSRAEASAFSVLVFMTQRLLWPLTSLGETLDLFQRAMASTTRILDLTSRPSQIVDGPRSLDVAAVSGDLGIHGVRFAYPGTALFDGLEIDFPAPHHRDRRRHRLGQVVDHQLLLRFYDPGAGRVTLDGVDVREFELPPPPGHGLVSQDVFLFHGTIAENIAYARPEASAGVRAAAAAAEAEEWIASLPMGYEPQSWASAARSSPAVSVSASASRALS